MGYIRKNLLLSAYFRYTGSLIIIIGWCPRTKTKTRRFSLCLISVKGCVVTQLEQVNILVSVIVEEDCGSSLALEVYAELLLVGHLKDLDLELGALENRLNVCLFVLCVINLLLHLKVQLPCCVRHLESLALLCHLLG